MAFREFFVQFFFVHTMFYKYILWTSSGVMYILISKNLGLVKVMTNTWESREKKKKKKKKKKMIGWDPPKKTPTHTHTHN